MVRDGRLTDGETLRNFPTGNFALSRNKRENLKAPRVRQRLANSRKLSLSVISNSQSSMAINDILTYINVSYQSQNNVTNRQWVCLLPVEIETDAQGI